MPSRTVRFVILGTLPILATFAVLAQAADGDPTTYVLGDDSTFQRGCFDPCDCVIYDPAPLHGTFNLRFVSSDPDWFDTYEVSDLKWSTTHQGQDVTITGSGIYRIGGNFALQHRLALDLVVGGDAVEHYDSGLVVGGSEFPAIEIKISINGEYCYDTVMDLHAKPSTTVKVDRVGLSWDPMAPTAGYDVVHGDLGTLLATGGDFTLATLGCIAAGLDVPVFPFSETPAPGQAYWFLVRGQGEMIVTTYDSGFPSQVASRDPGIAAAPTCCP